MSTFFSVLDLFHGNFFVPSLNDFTILFSHSIEPNEKKNIYVYFWMQSICCCRRLLFRSFFFWIWSHSKYTKFINCEYCYWQEKKIKFRNTEKIITTKERTEIFMWVRLKWDPFAEKKKKENRNSKYFEIPFE